VLWLSGGIDSVRGSATIATDAWARSSWCSMPGFSHDSRADAHALAQNPARLRVDPIQQMSTSFPGQPQPFRAGGENLQARVRAVILMALSNHEGPPGVDARNKSELAVGYSTLYGDSVGAFTPVLKDVPKTWCGSSRRCATPCRR